MTTQEDLAEEVKSLRKDLAQFKQKWQKHEESTDEKVTDNLIIMGSFVIFVNCILSML